MRSLFLKIFFWFWLANTLALGALALVVWIFPYSSPPRARSFERLHELQVRGALAVRDSLGQSAFEQQARQLEEAVGVRTFWVAEDGAELRGQAVPDELLAIIAALEAPAPANTPDERRGPPKSFVIPLTDAAGRRVYAAVEFLDRNRPPYFEEFISSREFALRALAVVLVAGLGCYALARYIASPVRRLQDAARRLAAGDFAVRVGRPIATRRDEIGQLGREFDRMAAQVEALVASQKRLLQDVSHELRSPLARLNVALELVRRDAGAGVEQPLARAGLEADRLNELIGQLLAVARLDTHIAHPQRTRVDMRALVESVVDDANFEAAAAARIVRVIHCDECDVMGAPDLLRSAVENVVRNAVRHTPAGTAVEISLRRNTTGAAPAAQLEIRDRGPGVPGEALASIFQPFYRVADARDAGSGGVGLGLAITRRAVELHGGTVSAANAADGGLIVRIELPGAAPIGE